MLDDNNLLQVNATVIVGFLVLLTIYSLKYPISIQEKRAQKILRVAIAVVIVPFAVSAILTIVGWLGFAEAWAVSGFAYLVVAIFLILNIPTRGINMVKGSNTLDDEYTPDSTK